MEASRIAELLEPYLDTEARSLAPEALQNISTYIDILQRWNARVNLTAIRNEEEIVTRHFGESLFAARHLFPSRFHVETAALGRPAEQSSAPAAPDKKDALLVVAESLSQRGRAALKGRVRAQEENGALAPVWRLGESPQQGRATESAAERRQNSAQGASRGLASQEEKPAEQRKKISLADIGSGAGFPGIPIKLWAPEISLTLIESNHKKATFLHEVARTLTLTDIDIQNTRAETLIGSLFDVVTLRAVERFETVLPVAASLVALDGRLALLISSDQIQAATSTVSTVKWAEPIPIPLSRSRIMLVSRNQKS